MSLLELQRTFQGHIVDAAEPIEDRMFEQRGLRVYRHAYRATLIDCLRDTYEKTAAWLGNDAFTTAANSYVNRFPPQSWTLADYGHQFPELLATTYPDDPEVAELAWLDHALRTAFTAADVPSIDAAALAGVDWETARIRLAPHVQARGTQTNVVAIWNALAASEMPPPCENGQAGFLLVWRDGLSPRFRTAQPTEAAAMIVTLSGKTFAETCALVCSDLGVDAAAIGTILAGWLRDGLIAAID